MIIFDNKLLRNWIIFGTVFSQAIIAGIFSIMIASGQLDFVIGIRALLMIVSINTCLSMGAYEILVNLYSKNPVSKKIKKSNVIKIERKRILEPRSAQR